MLLLSVGAALGGLALLPGNEPKAVSLTAAAATLPTLINSEPGPVSGQRDLSRLDPPEPRAPARASRTRRAAPPPPEYFRPIDGIVTSMFKWRWGRMHTGTDIAGPYGAPVRAVTKGTVVEAGWAGGYGYLVKIDHGGGVVTMYAHLSAVLVEPGPVQGGEVIGREGSSGSSTGPHLHFEVRVDGVPVNAVPWLAARGIFY